MFTMNQNIRQPASLIILLRQPLSVSRLTPDRETQFVVEPPAETRRLIADALGLTSLRKFRLTGTLRPLGKSDWELRADLGATVVQECVVTLAPVITRIDERVLRRYMSQLPDPEGTEVEMPSDDTLELLGNEIDPGLVAYEALNLALPLFPRAPDLQSTHNGLTAPKDSISPAVVIRAAPPGVAPLDDDDIKPFAGLKGLRDRLSDPGTDNKA